MESWHIHAEISGIGAEITAARHIGHNDRQLDVPFAKAAVLCGAEFFREDTVMVKSEIENIKDVIPSSKADAVLCVFDGAARFLISERILKECDRVAVKYFLPLKKYVDKDIFSLSISGLLEPASFDANVYGAVYEISSKTDKINIFAEENMWRIESDGMILPGFQLDIASGEAQNRITISRRPFDESIARCVIVPNISGKIAEITPIGGINSGFFPVSGNALKSGEEYCCYVTFSIIPPKGIKISNGKMSEELIFEKVQSYKRCAVVEALFAKSKIEKLIKKEKTASERARCKIQKEIEELCRKFNLVYGENVLCFTYGEACAGGAFGKHDADFPPFGEFRETDDKAALLRAIALRQNDDGSICEADEKKRERILFSTAVCLIALYLYGKDLYRNLSFQSLKFIGESDDFLCETARKLWRGETVPKTLLKASVSAKEPKTKLEETAIYLIKNFGEE